MTDESENSAEPDDSGTEKKSKATKKKAAKRKPAKRKPAKKKAAKKVAKKKATSGGNEGRRTRSTRPFPACSFPDALVIPAAIQEHSSGQPVRRLTLFDSIGKAPDSGTSRQLITNSGKYGLTIGSYAADMLQLTDDGALATSEDASPREKARVRAKLAIQAIEPFNEVYKRFVGNKLPARAVLADAMKDAGVANALIDEAVDTFVVNAQFADLLQSLSGAERFVSLDHMLDSMSSGKLELERPDASPKTLITSGAANFAKTCFYITPIGEEGSERRKHSDLFLGSIVEPALEQFGFNVVRADAIEKPGIITKQVIEYLTKSRLVVADLSFHNPNVFYELAIRHAMNLPTVQVIREAEEIPFDVKMNRTITIDCSDIYSLVPKLEAYRSKIANQVRGALDDPEAADNRVFPASVQSVKFHCREWEPGSVSQPGGSDGPGAACL